jgi:hypothetical protein
MLDVDTFLTTLYVIADDFCHSRAPKRVPGPEASLCASEVITLAIFARWSRFGSERDFYRYAETNLRSAFPTLPSRPQFNRLLRSHTELIEDFFLHLARSGSCASAKVPLRSTGHLGYAYPGVQA